MSKAYDIVVYGASGFTGRLCVKYLLGCSAASTTRFAAAGRSEGKIKSVLAELGAPDVPVLTADSNDEEALVRLVKQTKLVITTVGPYSLYGDMLVKVCAENGVHCLDLAGEPNWAYKMKEQYQYDAEKTKAIFIHGSGFDSIPSDINTYLAVQKLKSASSANCGLVTSAFKAQGGFSGGTFGTMLQTADVIQQSKQRRIAMDPYALSPIRGKDRPSVMWSINDGPRIGAFWIMGPVNTKMVYQTWGTLEEEAKSDSSLITYGPDFKYTEYLQVSNRFVALLVSATFYIAFGLLGSAKWIRKLAAKYGLQSGAGPDEKTQDNGFFRVITTARDVPGKTAAQVTMKGSGDPGYKATAAMICETALGIVHEYDQLTDLAKKGGHLTPALVFGDKVLKRRLEETGSFSWDTKMVTDF